MEKRRLGQSSLHIAPLAFGGNVFGWTTDEPTSFALLDAFVAAGFNFIDSADVYSRWHPGNQGGESETIIGKWLKARGNRDKVIIATKLGIEMGPGKKGLSRTYMMQAVEASLRRLQTDYIDLYQSHRDDPRHADRGNAVRLCRADQAGQGARDRRIEFQRRAAGGIAAHQHRAGPAALPEPAAAVQPGGTRRPSRASWRSSA